MVTTYSQLLLKGYQGQLAGDAASCVEFIAEGAARMRDLLCDLIAYTSLSAEAHDSAEPVDFNLVFRKVIESFGKAIQESQASVTSDSLPIVAGHEPHFVQLLQNLIANALKYRAGIPPRIHVSAIRDSGFWRIAVSDNGIGIDPEYHQKIFGVFKRLHGGAIPGTGIGLAICQRVVERYGGRIWVESRPNEGATFYFTVPAAPSSATSQPQDQTRRASV